ncbi:EF-hand domain-containing protein [Fodinicurvata halophila]|uniref:EF-hand domain-containing protein n=1 Tax=Fodinicurvata halophila TaxID=1419723 RepID=A0ABV8UQB4_9PROT
MKTTAAILAGGLAALMAASAWATDGADKDERRAEHRERMQTWMENIDTNDDGYISADEAETARNAMFERQDADGDGRITREEMATFIESYHRDRMPAANSEEMRDRMFERMDRDEDGVITEQEYTATGEIRFERMAGEDDRISISEVMARMDERHSKRSE